MDFGDKTISRLVTKCYSSDLGVTCRVSGHRHLLQSMPTDFIQRLQLAAQLLGLPYLSAEQVCALMHELDMIKV